MRRLFVWCRFHGTILNSREFLCIKVWSVGFSLRVSYNFIFVRRWESRRSVIINMFFLWGSVRLVCYRPCVIVKNEIFPSQHVRISLPGHTPRSMNTSDLQGTEWGDRILENKINVKNILSEERLRRDVYTNSFELHPKAREVFIPLLR